MRCPFVLETPSGYCCEMKEDIFGGRHPVPSIWACDHDGFLLCTEYLDRMREAEEPDRSPGYGNDMVLPGIVIGHINRIGGPRALAANSKL